MFRYAEGAVVALKNDMPGLELKAGNIGVIWALYDTLPPMYEITFQDPKGEKFDLTLAEEDIVAAVSARIQRSPRRSLRPARR